MDQVCDDALSEGVVGHTGSGGYPLEGGAAPGGEDPPEDDLICGVLDAGKKDLALPKRYGDPRLNDATAYC